MRVMPYRTTDNKIDGAVITFASIDEQKKSQLLIRRVFDMNPGPLVVLDNDGKLVIANDSFGELFEMDGEESFSLFHGALEKTDLKNKVREAMKTGESFETDDFKMESRNGTRKYIIQGEIVPESEGLPCQILLSFRETDERR